MITDLVTMGGHLLSLVLLLVSTAITNGRVELYIKPSPDAPCPQDPCPTLSQFATSPSNYIGNDTDISLILLYGKHSLERELSVYGSHNFTMKSQEDNGTVEIECASQSARFVVNETTFVSIKGLQLIGCGGNTVTAVEELVVDDTIFQGEGEGRGTALDLDEVQFAQIFRTEFILNSPGEHSERHEVREFVTENLFTLLIIFGLQPNDLVSVGGALLTTSSNVSITNTKFDLNTAELGGVLLATNSNITITQCTYSSNSAHYGGVIFTNGSSVTIDNSTFNNNAAKENVSGVDNRNYGDYYRNYVSYHGGVMLTFGGSLTIMNSSFANNKAGEVGGVIWSEVVSSLSITSSSFTNNTAGSHGGIMFTIQCSTHISDSTFQYNSGSLYTFSGNLTISGQTKFENCVEPTNKTSLTFQEGGAVTSFQSTVIFDGTVSLSNNQARQGGAILATESRIMFSGAITIANNTAILNSTATSSYGGGISLQQSELDIKGRCTISDNYAMRGGGVHAKSSTITVHQPWTLQVMNNKAENGGGMYLEVNPKLYLLKTRLSKQPQDMIVFSDNQASYGGAVYVADDTNSGACLPNNECFIQTLALYQGILGNTQNIHFSGNTATESGPNLFGGLLDRCVPSSFSEVYQKQPNLTEEYYNGVSYLQDLLVGNITLDSISSPPVRVCFCNNESQPDCSYQHPPIKVKKGETFKVSLVAVDQVNHSVDADIISFLASPDSGFSDLGQQTQPVGKNCTDLTFNVISSSDSDTINLYADGPCGSSELSQRNLDIQFLNCTCSVGFQPSNSESRCECTCDPKLSSHITDCNSTTGFITKEGTNSWINYTNGTDPPGYVIHPNCPFDYCKPQTLSVSINLNLPNGADAQCAYNRTGTLCGACQQNLSLSLGSSRCLPCPGHWPAVFVTILLAAIIAGILLVTALLALNMTVAVGLINGFIFYANIVSANSAVFFPSSEPSFPTVFVAWLNLDLGIDVCFIDGLDTYTKTWLQLAFPLYIISLVVIVIIVSEYSPRFAALIGKKDPIATLATLILLSYAKLLSITITALSSATMDYPDGSREMVWLPDANVKYFLGKHAALVIVALLIILVGVPYTLLLLLWQWIVRAPRWRVFNWTRNTKLIAFIAAYHVPYNTKYRYWTGLLLLVRVVLYITASLTVSDNPQVALVATIILVGGSLYS